MWKPKCRYDNIILISSLNEKRFGKKVLEKIKTQIIFLKYFSEYYTVYEIMYKRMVGLDRPQMIIYRIYSRNSRTFLTKILYLNLGCVIYARKRFYVGL